MIAVLLSPTASIARQQAIRTAARSLITRECAGFASGIDGSRAAAEMSSAGVAAKLSRRSRSYSATTATPWR
jgi:hypothetical protein